MLKKIMNFIDAEKNFLGLFITSIIAIFIFIPYYSFPNKPFWDENYHIASAQKYIEGVMYMEPHPPLGKLLMALGEKIHNAFLGVNNGIPKEKLINTDFIKEFPENYNFQGMRFVPVMAAVANAILVYAILMQIITHPLYATLFSFLYIFNNAIVVHSRGAMLDSIQIFFILLSLYYFIRIWKGQQLIKFFNYFILGLYVGAAISVKVNSAVLLVLFPILSYKDYKNEIQNCINIFIRNNIKNSIKQIFIITKAHGLGFAKKALLSCLGIILIFLTSFYVHCALGTKVVEDRYYHASDEYKEILKQKQTANPLKLPIMLRDNLLYMSDYEKNVPRYNPTKESENGSYPFEWVIGFRPISYRWHTFDDGYTRYLYLVNNPFSVLISIISLILGVSLFVGIGVYHTPVIHKRELSFIALFLFLYISYMVGIMTIKRVMYMYHYFIPYIFTIFLAASVFTYIFKQEILKKDKLLLALTIILAFDSVLFFAFYSPFTYYAKISNYEFIQRAWFDFWQMKYAVR